MSAKINYTNEPLGRFQVIPDFLPSPEELAFREEGVKVTLALSKKALTAISAYVDAQALTHRSSRRTTKRRAA
jgi:hypothetical protein